MYMDVLEYIYSNTSIYMYLGVYGYNWVYMGIFWCIWVYSAVYRWACRNLTPVVTRVWCAVGIEKCSYIIQNTIIVIFVLIIVEKNLALMNQAFIIINLHGNVCKFRSKIMCINFSPKYWGEEGASKKIHWISGKQIYHN